MMSASTALKQVAIRKQITRERERIINAFAANPQSTHRAITKIARSILLNGPYLLSGRYWDIKTKSLGAGVHELSAFLKES